ncbi:MAG: NAD-dependent epimerase/dehydratase family protein [Balneolales bacterium]
MNWPDELNGKQVLITGGTGFIGGRLVEILKTDYDVNVRVLVSNMANVARIARFSVDMIKGDICNPEEVERAVDGCDYVFHCAYGNKGTQENRRRINIEGTRNILAASLNHNVKKVIYLSTIMVYGDTPNAEIDETAPRKFSGGVYSDTKIEAENLAFDYHTNKGLPVTILQPTAVYGPFAPVWSTNVIDKLKKGTVMLINKGEGLCNGVYIDDVVNAILLAAVNKDAEGKAFIISGNQPVSWKEFYSYYENMLGCSSTQDISEADATVYMARLRTRKSLLKVLREDKKMLSSLLETPFISNIRKAAMKILPQPVLFSINKKLKGNAHAQATAKKDSGINHKPLKPVHAISDADIQFFKTKAHFKIDKAKKVLGYEPRYNFEDGMKLTELWAEAANLLDKNPQHVK